MRNSIALFGGLVFVMGITGMSAGPGAVVAAGPEASDLTLRITTCLPNEQPMADLEVEFALTLRDGQVIREVVHTDALGVVAFDGSAAECCDIVHLRIGPATRALNYRFVFTRACNDCAGRAGPWDIKNWTMSDCRDLNCCPELDKVTGVWHLRLVARP
jgi:hypothetical protein